MTEDLTGKRILVVGASSGIGRAIGTTAARAGGRVAFAARRAERCEEAAREAGPASIGVGCDVRDPSACDAVVARAVDAFEGLDALVYAAGVSPLARLADADAKTWRTLFETNVIGAGLVCRAALPHLREARGRAVFLSSSSVGRPYPALSVYAASKAALEEMVRGWRAENPDLCFSCVVVGPTAGTEFGSTWDEGLMAETLSFWEKHGYDSGRAAMRLDDVASAVLDVLTSSVRFLHVSTEADPHRATSVRKPKTKE